MRGATRQGGSRGGGLGEGRPGPEGQRVPELSSSLADSPGGAAAAPSRAEPRVGRGASGPGHAPAAGPLNRGGLDRLLGFGPEGGPGEYPGPGEGLRGVGRGSPNPPCEWVIPLDGTGGERLNAPREAWWAAAR